MEMLEKLLIIQNELRAPKNQYNGFGKYAYRNCEDILEALKPLLSKHKAIVMLSDTVENIGNRYYVKAVAKFIDIETGKSIENSASAREEETKKGYDASQITGSASSYARKYALNGLFCIDDNKDADYGIQQDKQPNNVTPVYFCEICGKQVKAEIAEKSKRANGGHVFCSGTCKREAGM